MFPRFYVDADVMLPLASIRRIAARFADGDALAAAPVMNLDLRGSSLAVRAYYRVWARLPYVREGMIGVGVYALSDEGRRRFGEFPDVIADDGYVRMLFGSDERIRVDDAPVRVYAPERLSDLVRIKTRSRLGRYELQAALPRPGRARAGDEVVRQRDLGHCLSTLAMAGRHALCGGCRSILVVAHAANLRSWTTMFGSATDRHGDLTGAEGRISSNSSHWCRYAVWPIRAKCCGTSSNGPIDLSRASPSWNGRRLLS